MKINTTNFIENFFMEKDYLKKIELDQFTVKNFGKVNLITGKNRVGKTFMLERISEEVGKHVFWGSNKSFKLDLQNSYLSFFEYWFCNANHFFGENIENGLHYSLYEDFWSGLFSATKKFKTQVFLTTHSREMILSFARIASSMGINDACVINLSRRADNSRIVVGTRVESNNILAHYDLGMDVRD